MFGKLFFRSRDIKPATFSSSKDDIWDIREVPASSVRRLPEAGGIDCKKCSFGVMDFESKYEIVRY